MSETETTVWPAAGRSWQKARGRRAATVRSYLVEHGIARVRITAEGMGETKPVAAEFGPSFGAMALGMTLMAVAGALFSPFLGAALDRHSIRRIMLVGVALMAGGFGLMSVAPARKRAWDVEIL